MVPSAVYSKAVILLLCIYCLLLPHCLWEFSVTLALLPSVLCSSPSESWLLYFFMFKMPFCGYCSLFIPHGAIGWSVV